MVVRCRIDQVADDLFGRPSALRRAARRVPVRQADEAPGRTLQKSGERIERFCHRRTLFATPLLLALSDARMTSRCSPGGTPVSWRTNFSRSESITPSAASTGTQLAASSEYS